LISATHDVARKNGWHREVFFFCAISSPAGQQSRASRRLGRAGVVICSAIIADGFVVDPGIVGPAG